MSPDASDLDLSVVERHSSDSKDSSVTCSDNAIEDIVEVARANVIANEEAVVLTALSYTTGWFYPMERYANSVLIGPSAGGKTLVQTCVKKLLPDECIYTATDFSANAMIDDPEWDQRLVAVLDEYDKVESGVREMLKSMAGEDRGYTKKRNVENRDAQGGYAPEEISSHAKPFGILYAPRGKKASIDHELSTRMITIHVEDSKHIREAIGRKEAGHTNISIRGYDKEFIFDASESAKAVRQRLRELPTVEGQSQAGYDGLRGSSYAYVPQWVWYAVRPIFNRDRTYTNRVYGQIFNLIRSSALLNHPNRPTANRTVEGEDVRANAVVQPQDVANVLSCQPTLLAQTHKLDPRKRAILEAVNSVAGMSDEGAAVLDDIREWLDANDKPCPSESTLRSLLKDDLREDWFIKVNDGAGPNGADLFSPRKETGLHPPRLTDLDAYAKQIDGEAPSTPFGTDLEAPFVECRDPIRNQPFVETVRQFREDFMGGTKTASTDAASYMGADGDGDEDSADPSDGDGTSSTAAQTTLGGDGADTDVENGLDPDGEVDDFLAGVLLKRLREEEGEATPVTPVHTVSHYLGIVEDASEDPIPTDIEGTLLDPDNDVYDHPSFADGAVTTPREALRRLDDAFADLRASGHVALDDDSDEVPSGFQLLRVSPQ